MTELDFTQLFLALTLLLILAKSLGEVCERVGLSAIVGEIAAGIVVGPSLLGPLLFSTTPAADRAFELVAELGAVFLLFWVGYREVRIERLKEIGIPELKATPIAFGVPFVSGFLLALAFGRGVLSAMFLGLAVSLTGLGVAVRTLMDVGKLQTDYGTDILWITVLGDIFALVVLGVLGSAVGGERLTLGATGFMLLRIALFFSGAYLFYRFLISPVASMILKFQVDEAKLGLVLGILFTFCYLSSLVGLHMVIGAFVAGLIVARKRELRTREMELKISGLAYGLFIPLFFALLGSKMQLNAFWHVPVLAFAVVVLGLASKFLGGLLGGLASRMNLHHSLMLGFGLMPKGGVDLVVIALGLKYGAVDFQMFSAFMGMVLLSLIAAPILLKLFGERLKP